MSGCKVSLNKSCYCDIKRWRYLNLMTQSVKLLDWRYHGFDTWSRRSCKYVNNQWYLHTFLSIRREYSNHPLLSSVYSSHGILDRTIKTPLTREQNSSSKKEVTISEWFTNDRFKLILQRTLTSDWTHNHWTMFNEISCKIVSAFSSLIFSKWIIYWIDHVTVILSLRK